MGLTRTFKISGALVAAGVLLVAGGAGAHLEPVKVLGIFALVFGAPVFAVSATRHLLRGLLWRVGSRLFVSYVLIGIVPLPFLAALVLAGSFVVAGPLAARRVEAALQRRASALRAIALEAVADPKGTAALVESHDTDLPGLVIEDAAPAPLLAAQAPFLARLGNRLVIGAAVSRAGHSALVTLPIGRPLRNALERETDVTMAFHVAALSVARDGTGRPRGISIHRGDKTADPGAEAEGDVPPAVLAEMKARRAGPKSGLLRPRWVVWAKDLDAPFIDAATGLPVPKERVYLVVNSSVDREFDALFASAKPGASAGPVVLGVMGGLGIAIATVYVIASLLAALLVLRIARATSRLSSAFRAVAGGDFTYRARLKGHDQLAGLIEGFNRMAAHLDTSVREGASQKAVEHELLVARDLQRRLLPSPDFAFPGAEIAVDFRPAAAIGGDFYHLAAVGDKELLVVIADVSGHGLATGIVMASAKASLSALAGTGATAVDLFTALDREIAAATDPRTFVTLAHARFRLDLGILELTNAGQLYPYRVERDGRVRAIENPSRPLGIASRGGFRTVASPIAEGDLWVFLSDGIVEAHGEGDEDLGFQRLEAVLAEGAGGTAAALRDRILEAWHAFTRRDEPEDDRTLIVVRIGTGAGTPPSNRPPAP